MALPIANDPWFTGMSNDTGTGVDGTIGDKAWFAQLAAALDAVLKDPASTQTPADTTAELRAARGTTASLSARLASVIGADGSFLGTATDIRVTGVTGEAIPALSVVYCSDGSGGRTAGLWYLSNATNDYSSSKGVKLAYSVGAVASGAIGSFTLFGSVPTSGGLTPGARYYASTVAGGVTSVAPGNIAVVGTAKDATNIILDFGGLATLVDPYPKQINHTAGVGLMTGPAAVRVASDVTNRQTVLAAETGIGPVTVKANTLDQNTDFIEFEINGYTAANANNKTVKFYWGATVITCFNAVVNGKQWYVKARVIRTTAANVQLVYVFTTVDGLATTIQVAAAAENCAADVLAQFTGQGTANNDIGAGHLIGIVR